ncbi:thermonuclease family protein [Thermococcus sp. GR6]|uniref:thermonuclease family protein n=1 Tax=Thermococcus sp. GR6 TaxID=1638256 RepID=UPI0014320F8B|nr:thermonuclease family protein [Thermococcus sp. GR6]NJE43078.1 nuclease [Thermococcus sp. GR6]
MGRSALFLTSVILMVVFVSGFVSAYEFEAYGKVIDVVDGDTIWFQSYSGYHAGETFKIRLADINAPEIYTSDGKKAWRALTRLILGEYVYIDVDDIYETDPYDRVVAVVYLPYWDDGYALNVNEWLVENGYAYIWDHYNEFNPYEWALWVPL